MRANPGNSPWGYDAPGELASDTYDWYLRSDFANKRGSPGSTEMIVRKGPIAVAQCQSKVFFPDDPAYAPQFNDCPRPAETVRRTFRLGDRNKGEPSVVNSVMKLCSICARALDGYRDEANRSDLPPTHSEAPDRRSIEASTPDPSNGVPAPPLHKSNTDTIHPRISISLGEHQP
jgi:hypothetical protein